MSDKLKEDASKEIGNLLNEKAEKNPNADLTDDDVERFVDEMIHESRKVE